MNHILTTLAIISVVLFNLVEWVKVSQAVTVYGVASCCGEYHLTSYNSLIGKHELIANFSWMKLPNTTMVTFLQVQGQDVLIAGVTARCYNDYNSDENCSLPFTLGLTLGKKLDSRRSWIVKINLDLNLTSRWDIDDLKIISGAGFGCIKDKDESVSVLLTTITTIAAIDGSNFVTQLVCFDLQYGNYSVVAKLDVGWPLSLVSTIGQRNQDEAPIWLASDPMLRSQSLDQLFAYNFSKRQVAYNGTRNDGSDYDSYCGRMDELVIISNFYYESRRNVILALASRIEDDNNRGQSICLCSILASHDGFHMKKCYTVQFSYSMKDQGCNGLPWMVRWQLQGSGNVLFLNCYRYGLIGIMEKSIKYTELIKYHTGYLPKFFHQLDKYIIPEFFSPVAISM